jgi:hypothetical protein
MMPEMFIKIEVQKNYLLRNRSWEVSANYLEEPLTNFTVVRASREFRLVMD